LQPNAVIGETEGGYGLDRGEPLAFEPGI